MSPDQAGRRSFRDALDLLQDRLVEMSGLVERLLKRAVVAFLERDASVVEWARAEDDRIDEIELEIDELGLELLALHQPMAKDLRLIITALKVANDLERVGDHGLNIAHAAHRISTMAGMPEVPELQEMAERARGMLADALAAYMGRDPQGALEVCLRDDRVDSLRHSLHRILVTHMLEQPRSISPSLEFLLVAQNLERVADLSTNISEDVVFLVEGRNIKHDAAARSGPAEDGPGQA